MTNTTIHDEEKIKEIFGNVVVLGAGEEWYNGSDEDIKLMEINGVYQAIQKYAQYIHQKTIDDCIACVPKELYEYDDNYEYFNQCREETITNLEQLNK